MQTQTIFSRLRKTTYKILILQIIILASITLFFFVKFNLVAALSALMGGSAWIIPNLYFIHRLCKTKNQTKPPQQIIKDFYFGEFLKLLISAILVAIFAKFALIKLAPFLIGYIATVLSSWLTPLFFLGNKGNNNASTK